MICDLFLIVMMSSMGHVGAHVAITGLVHIMDDDNAMVHAP